MRTTQQVTDPSVACGYALITYGALSVIVSLIRLFQIGGGSSINLRIYLSSAGEALIAIASGFLLVLRPERLVMGISAWCCVLIIKDLLRSPWNMPSSYWLKDMNIVCHVLWNFAAPMGCMVGVIALRKRRDRTAPSISKLSCARCGYSLRGLTEPRCPECGRVYTLDEFYQL
jgi:hypothetical protein